MMKRALLFFNLFIVLINQAAGQKCDCSKALQFVEQEAEKNLASYQHQVVQYERHKEYDTYKSMINALAKKTFKEKDCIGIVARYISFFRDEHLSIQYKDNFFKFKTLSDTPGVRKTFGNEEIILPAKRTINKDLEGIWYFQDGRFSVNIFPNAGINRQWVGVMTNDDSLLWRKGQVKMELLSKGKNSFEAIYWPGTRQAKAVTAMLNKGVLSIGKNWKYYRRKEDALNKKSNIENNLSYSELSNQTNYLRIPSFDLEKAKAIDSIIRVNIKVIESKPNLIIDLRNNGGGGDRSYKALLPLVLDKREITDPIAASVWVSKENFKFYDSIKFEYTETKEDSLEGIKYVEELRPYIGKFTPIKFSKDTLADISVNPQKVAILINRGCGSSTEGFTILSMNSKKVKTFGENTAGAISYGDWRRVDIPNLPIWLTMATKKMSFSNGADIESVGIKPDFLLDAENDQNWIKEVTQMLEGRKRTYNKAGF